ncbi:MAG: molecular chaperone DnaJ [Oscillatoriales cyanobacterium RM2_1_1]|nr:molecular chaperone DnaJ [Oscillatoriales cyanobacterium SM2_3_0]NJO47355.1 molecular chaperone DnaJ [Oscillatoriales cyanobacterium RM2_1_1]
MNEKSPYEQLGVTLDASFDEIQDARDRLREEYPGEQKRLESIEAAYDAILMDRLRMRQEGKIKVPERIRFPERVTPPPAKEVPVQTGQKPAWLDRMLDTPSRADILWPSGIFLGLGALSFYPNADPAFLQIPLALGVAVSLYFVNRKEKQFGRAVLFTISGLILGLLVGGLLSPVAGVLAPEQIITFAALLLLWLVSCFLR